METPTSSLHLRHNTGRVIGAYFLVADAAGPGAHGVICGFEGDGFETGGVVGAYWGGDYEEECGAWGADTEGALGADYGWAQVEGVAWFSVAFSVSMHSMDITLRTKDCPYDGINLSSNLTNLPIKSINASPSKVGNASLADDLLRRCMFLLGLKSRTWPCASL